MTDRTQWEAERFVDLIYAAAERQTGGDAQTATGGAAADFA